MRRLPGPAYDRPGDGGDSRGSLRIVSGLAENTNSIFCDGSSEPEAANGCPVLLRSRNHQPRGKGARKSILTRHTARSPEREKKTRAFRLTKTYMDGGHPTGTASLVKARIATQYRSIWQRQINIESLVLMNVASLHRILLDSNCVRGFWSLLQFLPATDFLLLLTCQRFILGTLSLMTKPSNFDGAAHSYVCSSNLRRF